MLQLLPWRVDHDGCGGEGGVVMEPLVAALLIRDCKSEGGWETVRTANKE